VLKESNESLTVGLPCGKDVVDDLGREWRVEEPRVWKCENREINYLLEVEQELWSEECVEPNIPEEWRKEKGTACRVNRENELCDEFWDRRYRCGTLEITVPICAWSEGPSRMRAARQYAWCELIKEETSGWKTSPAEYMVVIEESKIKGSRIDYGCEPSRITTQPTRIYHKHTYYP
jgi:hypothetical protein